MAQFSKRRRNRHSKNKTRRYKKKGGKHKHDLDSKKKYMKTGAYISMGVTPIGDPPIGDPPIGDPPIGDPLSSVPPEVPNDALMMSHRSFALASILNRAHDAHIPFTKSRSKMETKLYEPTGHLAVAIEGERLCNKATRLCSHLASMTNPQMWTKTAWGTPTPTKEAYLNCTEAIQLYEQSIAVRYLPAYAPLAWICSRLNPTGSLRVCDACIVICDADPVAPHATLAKSDCQAIRAFIQIEMEEEREEEIENLPAPGQNPMEAMETPEVPRKTQEKIAEDSVRHGSKYGHALLWRLGKETKTTAIHMGVDFRIVMLADSLSSFKAEG